MSKFIAFFFLTVLFSSVSLADQLAYLSKSDAERAASFIQNSKKIGFYCGCCDNQILKVIKVRGVEVKHTGYEDYYEVFVTYRDHKEDKSTPVDLAYVWIKLNGVLQTVGKALGLEHDPCKTPVW